MGVPGCPEFARWIASMHSARTVLIATVSASYVVVVVTAAPGSGGDGFGWQGSLPLRREQGRADDSGVVPQLGWDDGRPQLDQGQEFVGDVADAAADDDQLRPQHALNQVEIGLKPPGVLLPGHPIALADRLSRPLLGQASVERQVS